MQQNLSEATVSVTAVIHPTPGRMIAKMSDESGVYPREGVADES